MQRLTLVRHAKAAPAHSGQEDWDRALEAQGQRDAAQMAQRLLARAWVPEVILSSPAVRALETAQIMARKWRTQSLLRTDERLYLAGNRELLTVVRELGVPCTHLMVFGHNPGITEFADKLSAERELDTMPTCGVYSLLFPIDGWQELEWRSGVDAELDYPGRI